MNIDDKRVLALQVASGAGLPYDMTLKAARAYLAFLEGKEAAGIKLTDVWNWQAAVERPANKVVTGDQGQKAPAKKAVPAKAIIAKRVRKSA